MEVGMYNTKEFNKRKELKMISAYSQYTLYYDVDSDSICFFDGEHLYEVHPDDVFKVVKDSCF